VNSSCRLGYPSCTKRRVRRSSVPLTDHLVDYAFLETDLLDKLRYVIIGLVEYIVRFEFLKKGKQGFVR